MPDRSDTWLVVNADDFGLSPEVNAGVLHAFRYGLVRSTSLLVTGPAWEDAMRIVRETPALDIGVHLAAFETHPVLPAAEVPRLVGRDGRFPRTPLRAVWHLLAPLSRATLEQLEREFRAQLERVLRAGITISHLDCHGHLQMLPPVFRLVVRLARSYRIPWVRLPCEAVSWLRCLHSLRTAQVLIAGALCRLSLSSDSTDGSWPRYPDRLLGMAVSGRLDVPWMCRQIHRLDGGVTELICHPGFEPCREGARRHGYRRGEEVAALTSSRLRQVLMDDNVRLTSFRELAVSAEWTRSLS